MPIMDRLVPPSFDHVVKYPGAALRTIQDTVDRVEQTRVPLPTDYQPFYDQGDEGACVGFGESVLMSILNRKKYDARWLYREAQKVDGFPDTPPYEGTTLSAGFDVLRDQGHARWYGGGSRPVELDEGIVTVNRWLTSVDQIRTAIARGQSVVLGINWYDAFYVPVKRLTSGATYPEWWLADERDWGPIVGGHCICAPLASDKRNAIGWLNSWGTSYHWPVWVPYNALERLLREDGEAAIVTDK